MPLWLPNLRWWRVKDHIAQSSPSLRFDSQGAQLEHTGSHARPWKPTALRRRILIPAFLYTIAFIVGLVLLIRKQKNSGAIVSNEAQDGQVIASIVFNYLPIVIAIIYSIYWGWVDLTVKRLEPWYQLSKPEGVPASNSLALQYATEFAPFVPVTAIRRGHWTVFASSTIMMLVFWAITPLQGALFVNESTLLSHKISLNASKGLITLEEQNQALTGNILVTGFSHLWLDQKLPPFSNESFALLPFSSSYAASGRDANVTYPTVLYGTNLECWSPARVTLNTSASDNTTSYPIFDDGKGCSAEPPGIQAIGEGESGDFRAHYIGYNGHASNPGLSSCPQNATHRFLALWYRSNLTTVDFEDPSQGCALFCEPTYFKQNVHATVSTTNMSILSYSPITEAEILPDSQFNRSLFEYIIWNGVTPRADFSEESRANRLDIPDATRLVQNRQLLPWGSSKAQPVDPMVGFAVGTTKEDPWAYLHPETMSKAFTLAHQLLFALAIQRVAANPAAANDVDEYGQGIMTLWESAVVMNVGIASTLCATFGIVALLTLYLMISYERRSCLIATDPDSVRKICSAAKGPDLYEFASRASALNFLTKKHATTSKQMFKLQTQRVPLQSVDENAIVMIEEDQTDSSIPSHDHKPVPPIPKPVELSLAGGSTFISFLLAITVSMIVLFVLIKVRHGLFFPFTNNFTQQILLNYVPIVAATLIEPFWVLLTRHACILQPFLQMTCEPTPSRLSLDLQYASMVPQLVQYRSLTNRHYIIAALATATLLANLLSIAMSSLFYLNPVEYATTISARALKTIQFQGDMTLSDVELYQPFYIVKTALENDTPLPPWLDNTHYYLPVSMSQRDDSKSSYLVNTTGIGTTMDCINLSAGERGSQTQVNIGPAADEILISVKLQDEDEGPIDCRSMESSWGPGSIYGDPSGRKAVEVVGAMISAADVRDVQKGLACQSYMLYAWLRTDISFDGAPESTNSSESSSPVNATKIDFDTTLIACKPKAQTMPVMLNITSDGSVHGAFSIGPKSDIPKSTNTSRAISAFMSSLHINFMTMSQFDMFYHNDTIAADWTNYFIKQLAGSSSFLNASEPVPDADVAIKYVSDIFTRSFAAGVYLKSDSFVDFDNSSSAAKADSHTNNAIQINSMQKIFMSTPMFYMAISVLIWDIIVAVVFYQQVPKPFLRHNPTSMLGILALFNGSHAMQEFTQRYGQNQRPGMVVYEENDGGAIAAGHRTSARKHDGKSKVTTTEVQGGGFDKDMEEGGGEGERSYAFGPFIGVDGRAHIGIDIFPYATPIFMKQAKKRIRPWRRKE